MNEFDDTAFVPAGDGLFGADISVSGSVTLGPDDFSRALREMWGGPLLPFSCWRKPGTRMYGRFIFPATSWLDRQREETAWEQASRPAWIDSVRAKLQSAVYATDQGWSWEWEAPGVFGRRDVPLGMTVRGVTAPPLYVGGGAR